MLRSLRSVESEIPDAPLVFDGNESRNAGRRVNCIIVLDANAFKPNGVKWFHFKLFIGTYWSNPPFLIFLTFGHSGAQD